MLPRSSPSHDLRVVALLLALASFAVPRPALAQPSTAPVRVVRDTLFGLVVNDPYRYMENLGDSGVRSWMSAQAAETRRALDAIPERGSIAARIRALDQSRPAVVSYPIPARGRVFYTIRRPDEEQGRLYFRDGLEGRDRLLVDPDAKHHAPAGRHYAIDYYTPSWDGRFLAYGASLGGSENSTLYVIDVASGQLTDSISRAQFGVIAWSADGSGFFYNRLRALAPGEPESARYLRSRVFYHRRGSDASDDVPILGIGADSTVAMDSTALPAIALRPGCRYAIAYVIWGVKPEVTLYRALAADALRGRAHWTKIVDTTDAVVSFEFRGDELDMVTYKDAPRFRIARTTLSSPDVAHAVTVVPQSDMVIQNILSASDALYVQGMVGGIGRVLALPYAPAKPTLAELPLPFAGTVTVTTDPQLPGAIVGLTSWTKAMRYLVYDPTGIGLSPTSLQPLGVFDEPPDLVAEEVRVVAKDGVSVPLSIVYPASMKHDGSAPTMLHGYGAYGISPSPYFEVRHLAWHERGGIDAVCHVRGGGEFGEEWHRAGRKATKPNTWNDMIACAQWLVDNAYTSPERLVGEGTSAGGITIGRAITSRPELFRAALIRVGLSDAVRAEFEVAGPANIGEFGTQKDSSELRGLYEMSAYHHVVDGAAYPAVLLTAGMNDPRVSPWQAAKMAARLQAATSSGRPVLLRIENDAGHGFGSTRSQENEELADIYAFALWQMRIPTSVSTVGGRR